MVLCQMALVSNALLHVFVMVMFCQNTPIQLMVNNTVRLFVVTVSKETLNNVMMATLLMVTDVHPPVRLSQLGVAVLILRTLVVP